MKQSREVANTGYNFILFVKSKPFLSFVRKWLSGLEVIIEYIIFSCLPKLNYIEIKSLCRLQTAMHAYNQIGIDNDH